MAYACGYFIYGVIVPTKLFGDVDHYEYENIFNSYYGDNGDDEVHVGVELAGIDEATPLDAAGVAELIKNLTPTAENIAGWQERVDAAAESDLPDPLKDFIAQAKPTVFLVWGSS